MIQPLPRSVTRQYFAFRVTGGLTSSALVLALVLCGSTVRGQGRVADLFLKQRYPEALSLLVHPVPIPGLRDGWIPQGVAYIPKRDWIVISAYHDDGKSASVLHVFDAEARLHLGTTPLMHGGKNMTGHVGGAAWCRGKLWLASEGQLWRLACPTPEQVKAGAQLAIEKTWSIDSAATSLAAAGDRLWVGEFALGTAYPTLPHHHLRGRKAWAAAYSISPDAELTQQTEVVIDGRRMLAPEAVVLLPDKVQGFAIRGEDVVLCTSYSTADSILSFYRSPLPGAGFEVPLPGGGKTTGYELPEQTTKRLPLPPGGEDLEWAGDQLLVPFEAGARKYKTRWQLLGAVIEETVYRLRAPELPADTRP